jgi:processing peptidase subunit alpha
MHLNKPHNRSSTISKSPHTLRPPNKAKTTRSKRVSHPTVRSFFSQRSTYKPAPLDIPYTPNNGKVNDYYPSSQIESQQNDFQHSKPQITKLANGMKIVTHNRKSFPVSHIALSIDVGSRYEDPSRGEQGITNYLQRTILRGTHNRLTGHLVRDMAKLGCDMSAASSRENFMISATTPTRINPVLGALADVVTFPAFDQYEFEVERQNYYYDNERREYTEKDVIMNELIHQAAFGNNGLGQSQFCPTELLKNLPRDTLREWHRRFFTPDRMVLSAVNVNHDEFSALAEEMFYSHHHHHHHHHHHVYPNSPLTLTTPPRPIQPPPQTIFTPRTTHYTKYQHAGLSQMAFYWQGPSIHSTDEVVNSLLLRQILGKGTPLSDGGPGKGLYTRLQKLIRENTWIPLIDSFSTNYSDIGLFGLYGLVGSEAGDYFIDVIRDELQVLAENLTDEEIDMGKACLIRDVLTQTNHDLHYCETLARHVQLFGESRSELFFDKLNRVETKHIKGLSSKMFTTPKSTGFVTYGEVSRFIPRNLDFDTIVQLDDDDDSSGNESS